jgi:hypothetical protein
MTSQSFAETWDARMDTLHAAELAGDGLLAEVATQELEDLAMGDTAGYEAMLRQRRAANALIHEQL